MTPQDHLTTAPTPQSTKSWRSGNLHHPGWRATRVGSRSTPTVHPCSQSGRRLWVARKALHLHEPNHEGNGRSIHNTGRTLLKFVSFFLFKIFLFFLFSIVFLFVIFCLFYHFTFTFLYFFKFLTFSCSFFQITQNT